jgi:hypothetical protein
MCDADHEDDQSIVVDSDAQEAFGPLESLDAGRSWVESKIVDPGLHTPLHGPGERREGLARRLLDLNAVRRGYRPRSFLTCSHEML